MSEDKISRAFKLQALPSHDYSAFLSVRPYGILILSVCLSLSNSGRFWLLVSSWREIAVFDGVSDF